MAEAYRNASPPLVALVSWLLPGGGYLLLGQRKRGLTVGITVVSLFILGLLIGGVRVIEVPGYDDFGRQTEVNGVWVMRSRPFVELRDKPWSIAQVLNGPVGILGGAWSVIASRPGDDANAPAAKSHARINEIGVLYTAVAGMLNLLAIIDAGYRAGHPPAPF